MPWETEQVKGISDPRSIGGVLYTAIFGDVKGVGDFLQHCYTAIIAALFAHKTLWAPAGINLKFGASPPAAEQK
jgi:hypothetical protein